jgi:hypothetical protein
MPHFQYKVEHNPAFAADPSDDDPIWGVPNFAPIINRSERQTRWLIQSGRLDVRKVGRKYTSTRRKLLASVLPEAV